MPPVLNQYAGNIDERPCDKRSEANRFVLKPHIIIQKARLQERATAPSMRTTMDFACQTPILNVFHDITNAFSSRPAKPPATAGVFNHHPMFINVHIIRAQGYRLLPLR
jgi:hypothetical protein